MAVCSASRLSDNDDNPNCEFIKNGTALGLRTCNSYWNPQKPLSEGDLDIDQMILGMSSQITEREDTIITPDLRGKSTINTPDLGGKSTIIIRYLRSKTTREVVYQLMTLL